MILRGIRMGALLVAVLGIGCGGENGSDADPVGNDADPAIHKGIGIDR